MKKLVSLCLCLLMAGFLLPAPVWAAPSVFLNTRPLALDVRLAGDASPMLPLSALSEAMGASVAWDAGTGMITVDYGRTTVQFKPGSGTGLLNHEELTLPAMTIENGTTMASLDFWKNVMSDYYDITWDPATQVVGITSRYPVHANMPWNGGVYDGSTLNNVPDGQGAIVFSDASSYKGIFHQGLPTPDGTWYSPKRDAEAKIGLSAADRHAGPNTTPHVVSSDGVSLCFADLSSTGSGQIYKKDPAAGTSRLIPAVSQCMDLENGWLYYSNSSENGQLFRTSIKDQTSQRLTDFPVRDLVAAGKYVFYPAQDTDGYNVINRVQVDSKVVTTVYKGKNPITDLQVNGDYLYFSASRQICRCDFNGARLTEIVSFVNPIVKLNVGGGWIYYLQQGGLYRINSDNTVWQKVAASEAGKENFTDLRVDDKLVYLLSFGGTGGAQYNGIYSCRGDGAGLRQLITGSCRLQDCVQGRLYYLEPEKKSDQEMLLKSVSVRDDQYLDIREQHDYSDPEAQYGWPDAALNIAAGRFVTNAGLAGNDPQIKAALEQIKIDIKKADLTITNSSSRLLIVDPAYLGSLYTDGKQNEIDLKNQGVLLSNFGGKAGPVFKTSDNGLKMLLAWDKRDENGKPVFPSDLGGVIKQRQISDGSFTCPSGRLLFLDYNSYWYSTLALQLKSASYLVVNMQPGHYLVGYEQWYPTKANPLDSSRRNLVMVYQRPLDNDEK